MNDLNSKILARNRVNGQVNELAPVILEAIKPFVGTKITLQTGGFAAKIKSVLDAYLGCNKIYPKLQICNSPSSYSFTFLFRTHEQAGEYSCVYQEEYVCFGVLEGHTLKSLTDFTPRKTNYNIEEINEWRTKYHQAEAIKSEMNSKLAHFGVY